jgi:uncharacterized damage-inducible protein DinB
MTRLDEIRELYDYNAWAMRRMFDATDALSEEEFTRDLKNSFPSIRDTLVHTVGAEWVWLTRWRGTSPTSFPEAAALMTNADVRSRWEEIQRDRDSYLASLTEASIDATLTYTNFAGKQFTFPLWQMLRHVVNHCSYHRGQITTMLRQLGHPAVSTDLILMYQERAKELETLRA